MSFITEELQKLSDFFLQQDYGYKNLRIYYSDRYHAEVLQAYFSPATRASVSGQYAFQRVNMHLVFLLRRKLNIYKLNK